MRNLELTFISDTHGHHQDIELPGGDILIHSGDFMQYSRDPKCAEEFLDWFNQQNYSSCILVAGNHERFVQISHDEFRGMLTAYKYVDYLQDEAIEIQFNIDGETTDIKIYGSPWQPWFKNWAFNLPRGGKDLYQTWQMIPEDVDILVTHTPPATILDAMMLPYPNYNLGCELLLERVYQIKPKIHAFGHIHGSYGYRFYDGTHFINASQLNDNYRLVNSPINAKWDPVKNELFF